MFLFIFKAFQLGDNIGQHIPYFAQVFGPNAGEHRIGEIRDLFLGSGSVVGNNGRILQIDLRHKLLDHLFILFRQYHLGDFRVGGFLKGRSLRGRRGLLGEIKGQRDIIKRIAHTVFLPFL